MEKELLAVHQTYNAREDALVDLIDANNAYLNVLAFHDACWRARGIAKLNETDPDVGCDSVKAGAARSTYRAAFAARLHAVDTLCAAHNAYRAAHSALQRAREAVGCGVGGKSLLTDF